MTNTKRRTILSSFYSLIVLLGLPFWLFSTSLDRHSLPKVDAPSASCIFNSTINVHLVADPLSTASSLIARLQVEYDERESDTYCVRFNFDAVHGYSDNDAADNSFYIRSSASLATRPTISSNSVTLPLDLTISSSGSSADDSNIQLVKQAIDSLLLPRQQQNDPRIVRFASNYNLFFSLLNENSISPFPILDWNIGPLLTNQISPLLSSLSTLHNFSIETQVQYFAPLTIKVHANTGPEGGTIIEEEDLRAFINSAGWNMPTSVTLDPALHFILYVPSYPSRPMRIRTLNGSFSESNAFITPQHGGVVIYNPPAPSDELQLPPIDLTHSFRLFSRQLRVLLGVPSLPSVSSLSLAPASPSTLHQPEQEEEESDVLASWQIASISLRRLRQATYESLSNLAATVTLANDIPNMRVGKEVLRDVRKALKELEAAGPSFSNSLSSSLAHASLALLLSTQAYFNPTMLALLYFPDEHKYAVYTPLFGPVAVPLLVALLREVKEWNQKRKRKKIAKKEIDERQRKSQGKNELITDDAAAAPEKLQEGEERDED